MDVLHANDWQTGLMPAYLKIEYRSVPRYERIASLLTVHNISYQGQFWHWDMLLTGLDWKYFNWRQMEFHGNLNLLKTGMVFADAISTVSPRYAQEIQSSPLGCGLEGVLQYRRDVLFGHPQRHRPARVEPGDAIRTWRPTTTPQSVGQAKPICKAALQKELGLPREPAAPLVGIVGRLTDQKGFDLVADVMQRWVQTSDVQWVDPGHRPAEVPQGAGNAGRALPAKSGRAAGVLQPAGPPDRGRGRHFPHAEPFRALRAEPALQPAVRDGAAGAGDRRAGRHDHRLRPAIARTRPPTGSCFRSTARWRLSECLRQACDAYRRPDVWRQLIATGMAQDWSGPAAPRSTSSCTGRRWSAGARRPSCRLLNRVSHGAVRGAFGRGKWPTTPPDQGTFLFVPIMVK